MFQQAVDSLGEAQAVVRSSSPSIVLVDKAFGMLNISDWLFQLHSGSPEHSSVKTRVVIWGASVTETETLILFRAGARGIVRKTATPEKLMECLRNVAAGRSWIEDCESGREYTYRQSELTWRQRQILQLVEQGFTNRDVALALGIAYGAVKIHLDNIFHKIGIHSRGGLALQRLKSPEAHRPLPQTQLRPVARHATAESSSQ